MAKSKRAAALFEVIHKDVRYHSPVRNHRTPLAWLRKRLTSRDEGGVATATTITDDANDPTRRPHPLLRGGLGMHEVDAGDRLPIATALATAKPPVSLAAPAPAAPVVRVDRSRQIIRFNLTYTSAAIAAFALLVTLSLAYYLGRGAAPRVAVAGPTTEQLRNGPSNPGVLNINGDAPPTTIANQVSPARNITPVPPPPAGNATSTQRIVGMNYVIVQSYPKEEDAREAAEILRQHGVPVSVVKGTAFAPRWHSVVGLKPFDHLSNNPEYAAYVTQIKQVSDKFASNARFKKFEPRPYKWQNH